MTLDAIGSWVAFALTLLALSYLGKEIPFLRGVYRLVAYLFVGVALGYGAVQAWHGVLVPRLLRRIGGGEWFYVVPLLLSLLLLSRMRHSWRGVGSLTIAFLFGVGTALAVGGALMGTLLPQVQSTFLSLNPTHYRGVAAAEGGVSAAYALDALLVALGTISSLLYFFFTSGKRGTRLERVRGRVVQVAAGLGKVFIMFTFGALFASAAISRIALLVDRVRFIIETVLLQAPST